MAALAKRALALISLTLLGLLGTAQAEAGRPMRSADPAPRLASAPAYYDPNQAAEEVPGPTADAPVQESDEASAEDAGPQDQFEEGWDDQNAANLAPVISSGKWVDSNCWTAQADFVLMHRTNPKTQIFTVDTTLPSTDGLGPSEGLTTDRSGFRVSPGTRITLSHQLFRDHDNRDHSIEISYLGPFDWQKSDAIRPSAPARLFSPQDPGFVFQPGPPVLRNAVFGAFAASDRQQVDYGSTLNSIEINTRTRWRLGRDMLVAMPDGGWSHQMDPGPTPSLFVGLRYLRLDENLNWTAQRFAPNPVANGVFNVETTNDLIGFQFGGDYVRQQKCYHIGGWVKAGGFVNFGHQHTHVLIIDAEPTFQDAFKEDGANEQAFTFVGEAGVNATYFLSNGWSVRGDLSMLWAQSVAVATNQIPFNFADTTKVNMSGNSFYLGASMGLEYVW